MTDQTPDRLNDLRSEYANTGMVKYDGAVWLISQVVVLRERLAAATPVPPPADQTALRDRTVAAIKRGPFRELSNDGKPNGPLLITAYVDDLADAVLPVLPEQTDRTAEDPAAECSAQNRNYESGPRLCIRAAQHHGDHIDERGFHWSDTVAVYPVSDGTFRRGTDVRALLRRMAAEEQPAGHSCRNCEGIDPDTCLMNPNRPTEQCPRSEFDGYGRQCQKPAGHNLCTFEEEAAPAERPAVGEQPETQETPRCVCGDPIEWWTGPNDSAGWIHSPDSDGPILDVHQPRPATDPQP